jgi:hypothetical protein
MENQLQTWIFKSFSDSAHTETRQVLVSLSLSRSLALPVAPSLIFHSQITICICRCCHLHNASRLRVACFWHFSAALPCGCRVRKNVKVAMPGPWQEGDEGDICRSWCLRLLLLLFSLYIHNPRNLAFRQTAARDACQAGCRPEKSPHLHASENLHNFKILITLSALFASLLSARERGREKERDKQLIEVIKKAFKSRDYRVDSASRRSQERERSWVEKTTKRNRERSRGVRREVGGGRVGGIMQIQFSSFYSFIRLLLDCNTIN